MLATRTDSTTFSKSRIQHKAVLSHVSSLSNYNTSQLQLFLTNLRCAFSKNETLLESLPNHAGGKPCLTALAEEEVNKVSSTLNISLQTNYFKPISSLLQQSSHADMGTASHVLLLLHRAKQVWRAVWHLPEH